MITIKIIKPGKDFSEAMKVRVPVFVEEQGVPQERELDDFDKLSYHAVLYEDEFPIACGRLYINKKENTAKLGRVAVLKDHRRQGYGLMTCKKLINIAQTQGIKSIILHAQTHSVPLYERLGFKKSGGEFLEENIPHYKMTKELSQNKNNKNKIII